MDYADQLDMMDDDCDIQGFPNGNAKQPEMTPQEAAEMLEHEATIDNAAHYFQNPDRAKNTMKQVNAHNYAASMLRKVAAGELKPVVHAHCIDRENDCFCSNCNSLDVAHGQRYCPYCGARMDGKP